MLLYEACPLSKDIPWDIIPCLVWQKKASRLVCKQISPTDHMTDPHPSNTVLIRPTGFATHCSCMVSFQGYPESCV